MEVVIAFDIDTLLSSLNEANEFWASAQRLVFGDGQHEPEWEHQWSRRSSRKAFRAYMQRRGGFDAGRAHRRDDASWLWSVDFAPRNVFQLSYTMILPCSPAEAQAKAERAALLKALPAVSTANRPPVTRL